jgi:hypothetical protein
MSMTQLEELEDKCAETDFGAALCGLTILRYVCACYQGLY